MIYVEVLDRYWNPGSRIMKREHLSDTDIANFHYWLAKEYKKLIVRAIDDQRYRSRWLPLSLPYYNYKKANNYSLGMWEMTGELKNALRIRRKGLKTVCVGFPRKKHEGTNLYYKDLAQILEFGNIRIPPRPLFRLAYKYVSSNINYFYDKYKKEGEL